MLRSLALLMLVLAAGRGTAAGQPYPQERPYGTNEAVAFPPYTVSGSPPAVDVTFDGATVLETGADFLDVADGAGRPIQGSPFTGWALSGRTVRVPGATVRLTLRTDASNPAGQVLGFQVTNIQPVADVSPAVATSSLPQARVGEVYRHELAAVGIPPFSWSVASGTSLPQGLGLTAGGVLVGIPGSAQTAIADLVVTDAKGRVAETVPPLTLVIQPPFGPRIFRAFLPPFYDSAPVQAVLGNDGGFAISEARAVMAFRANALYFVPGSSYPGFAASGATLVYSGPLGSEEVSHELAGTMNQDGPLVTTLFKTAGGLPAWQLDLPSLVFMGMTRLSAANGEVVFTLPPTADAGWDQRVSLSGGGQLEAPDPTAPFTLSDRMRPYVVLDGRRSVDPRGRPLTYAWKQIRGPTVTLHGSPQSPLATFTTTVPEWYAFELQVSNGESVSLPVAVPVHVERPGYRSPVARAIARSVTASGVQEADQVTPPLVVAPNDTVQLDARRSTDRDLENTDSLTYQWNPPFGVSLTPSATSPTPTVVIPAAGTYVFGFVVRNREGLADPQAMVRVVAAAGRRAPRLTVVATSYDTGTTGPGLGDGQPVQLPNSLRVSLVGGAVTTVTLKADLVPGDPSQSPSDFAFQWRVLSGAELEMLNDRSSTAFVRPTTPGAYDLECLATLNSMSGAGFPVTTRAAVRLLVESGALKLPVARPSIAGISPLLLAPARPTGPLTVPAGELVQMSGVGSSASVRTYRWVQSRGPAIELSDFTSCVTTFVAPNTRSGLVEEVGFTLYVDDGALRSEGVPVDLFVTPPSPRAFRLPLHHGLNLVGLAAEPLSNGKLFRMQDLLTVAGGRGGIRFEPADWRPARFHLVLPHTDPLTDFVVEPGRGYLFSANATAPETLTFQRGRTWDLSGGHLSLAAGLNLVALPGRPPPGYTAEDLRRATGAGFVARVVKDSALALPRFDVHLPGVAANPFSLEEGAGYLVSVPTSRVVSLPGE